jgi:lipopolysaccharide/colanic/teichoic acid biosynthesis glycosyltransferase
MQLTKVMSNHNEDVQSHSEIYIKCKRLLDITVSTLAIILMSPLLILTALSIKLCSKGPVLFWQKRAGLNGKTIMFPKFRSMYIDAEERKADLMAQNMHQNSITFKMKNDPRITPIGRIIRKYSIDELPQLILVLNGELSLVGPRPATLDEVAQYSHFEQKRLSVQPGLTCIWQVNGRGDIPFNEQVIMDYTYICERNLYTDVKLLFQTIPAVLNGRGAY